MTTDQLEITFPDGSIKTVRQILDDKDNLQAQVSELKERLKRSQELCGLLCDFIAAPRKDKTVMLAKFTKLFKEAYE